MAAPAVAASASAPASPTTWGWARRSRCWRCCWCSGNGPGRTLPPSLLVAPASLLANWTAEIERFAPSLKARIVHPSAMTAAQVEALRAGTTRRSSTWSITSYGTLLRMPALSEIAWRLVILDEAQAIKNPDAKQTRAAKALKAQARIALTGTPVENHLGDLWSIFDFINPGLLGGGEAVRPLRQAAGRARRRTRTGRCANWCAPTSCGG